METGWILLSDTSPTLETFRKRPRRIPMVFPSPTSTRDGYGHINGVPVLHSFYRNQLNPHIFLHYIHTSMHAM
ncbi:hypothetical protein Hanom_Chr16g01416151 [Helianthus anomalus]